MDSFWFIDANFVNKQKQGISLLLTFVRKTKYQQKKVIGGHGKYFRLESSRTRIHFVEQNLCVIESKFKLRRSFKTFKLLLIKLIIS